MVTNRFRLLRPTIDRHYFIAEDLPFQGFGLTAEKAIEDLERKIKEHIGPRETKNEKANLSANRSQDKQL